MPRYDPDIIAALAEGRLPHEEAPRVEREIAADPTAAAELAAHRTALAALAQAQPLRLTDLERAGMRAAISNAIGLVDADPVPKASARRMPWGSVGVAAAALFGLLAFVPVAGLLTTGGNDEASTALAPEAVTTTFADTNRGADAADTADPESAPVAEGLLGFDSSSEAPGGETDGFGTTTTARTGTTTTAVAEETPPTDTTGTTAPDPAPVDKLLEDLTVLVGDPAAVTAMAATAEQDASCWTEDAALYGRVAADTWSFEYVDGDITVVVFFEYDSTGVAGPFAVYGSDGCEPLAEITPDAP